MSAPSRLSVLAVALLLPLAAACGGGSDDAAPGAEADERSAAEVLDDAVDATLGIERTSVELLAMLDIDGQQLELGAEGRVDYEAVVADVTFSTEQQGTTQSLQIIADGETAWVSGEGAAVAAFPEGFTYLSGPADELGAASSFDPIDLVGVVLALRGAEEVEGGDTEEVDGVESRVYTTTVPYVDAVEGAGDDAEAFQSALSLTGDADVADLEIEVAVGPDDVVRRLELDIEAGDVPVGGSYTLTLTGVGEDVDVPEAPPADEVATGPEAEALFTQLLAS